jgi:AAA+ ATPase superfamily predicted ATPase
MTKSKTGKVVCVFEIEFHDREKEITEITNIVNSMPNLITFIYGPINSGKTELVTHTMKRLPDSKVVYINLRGIYVSKADDFLKVFFEVEEDKRKAKRYVRAGIEALPDFVPSQIGAIPIPKKLWPTSI